MHRLVKSIDHLGSILDQRGSRISLTPARATMFGYVRSALEMADLLKRNLKIKEIYIQERRKTHKKGKRVKLQRQFAFSTIDTLKIACEVE